MENNLFEDVKEPQSCNEAFFAIQMALTATSAMQSECGVNINNKRRRAKMAMRDLKARLSFPAKLSIDLILSLLDRSGMLGRRRAALACKSFAKIVRIGYASGCFKVRAHGISSGYSHLVVTTTQGELLTYGVGSEGQLGHGVTRDEAVPQIVSAMLGIHVVDAAAGSEATAIWTEDGALYTFGSGCHGQLGHGLGHDNRDDEEDASGMDYKESVPRRVDALRGEHVTSVACGDAHTLVLTAAGKVFSFGQGSEGQLGHGDQHNQLFPQLIEALIHTKAVAVATWDDRLPSPSVSTSLSTSSSPSLHETFHNILRSRLMIR